jgi:hypothetical protein
MLKANQAINAIKSNLARKAYHQDARLHKFARDETTLYRATDNSNLGAMSWWSDDKDFVMKHAQKNGMTKILETRVPKGIEPNGAYVYGKQGKYQYDATWEQPKDADTFEKHYGMKLSQRYSHKDISDDGLKQYSVGSDHVGAYTVKSIL